jgi:6-pyruvoyltetrahydropterin/6-carboxytetrahydropterin synthase|tara:strand:- start:16 stop:477 length:462 start_codon:yes stop_codon:yes gene_type:complete
MRYKSTKLFNGFTCCFRQWKAVETHCKYLHGYAVSFKVVFEGELDHKNWVWDFGGMKRAKNLIDGMQPKAWMDYMFDHTVVIAKDDPEALMFQSLSDLGVIQLREVEATGAEKFAEYVFNKLNKFVQLETDGRVKISSVEFMENGNNSAIYQE